MTWWLSHLAQRISPACSISAAVTLAHAASQVDAAHLGALAPVVPPDVKPVAGLWAIRREHQRVVEHDHVAQVQHVGVAGPVGELAHHVCRQGEVLAPLLNDPFVHHVASRRELGDVLTGNSVRALVHNSRADDLNACIHMCCLQRCL